MEITIRPYEHDDADQVRDLMCREGEEWRDYWGDNWTTFLPTLESSVTLLAFANNNVVGFIRARNDANVMVVVHDLLVDKRYRGHSIGRKLSSSLSKQFPGVGLYVMSDEDGYYEKQGYERVGSVFRLDEALCDRT
jgi:ribosomal protein S18 acetylase RimI-like enzyme